MRELQITAIPAQAEKAYTASSACTDFFKLPEFRRWGGLDDEKKLRYLG